MTPAPEEPKLPSTPPALARALEWGYRLFPWLLLPLMLVLSRDFGVSWDEKTHQLYGERVFRFLTQGLDDDWFRPGGASGLLIYLHGGLFDTVCVAVQKLVKGNTFVTRHYVNAVFGWLGVCYAGRLGRLLAGAGTGLLAMVLLVLSPRYFGDTMNNPKDVPLAALLIAALYYLMQLEPRYPYLRLRVAVPLAVSISLAVNVRAGGLLFLAYLALALAAFTLATRGVAPRQLAGTLSRYAALAVAVLLMGTIFWPWAQLRPLTRPFTGLRRLSHFEWTSPVLFAGRDIPANALPWDYVPRWLLIGTPPVVTLGALVWLVLALRRRGAAAAKPLSLDEAWRPCALLFAAVFPPVYVAATGGTIYDGIRHLTFAYPPLVVLAAWGWRRLLAEPLRALRLAGAAALALGLAEPALFQLRNHPNQYVYFNALAGGPRAAFGRYELDYWGNSLFSAAEWLDAAARASGTHLVVSGRPHHVVRDDVRRFSTLEFMAEEDGDCQLDVRLLRGERQDVLELAARKDILHAVRMADGTPLAIVIPGARYDEVKAALRLPPPAGLEAR